MGRVSPSHRPVRTAAQPLRTARKGLALPTLHISHCPPGPGAGVSGAGTDL